MCSNRISGSNSGLDSERVVCNFVYYMLKVVIYALSLMHHTGLMSKVVPVYIA